MPSTLTFEGDLKGSSLDAAVAAIDAVGAVDVLSVELGEVEVTDGRACAALAQALRQAAGRIGEVIIIEPPQALAHTLYRLGSLRSGTLQLIEPREELGTSS